MSPSAPIASWAEEPEHPRSRHESETGEHRPPDHRFVQLPIADAFLAATDSDNANAMAVQVAERVLGVRKTIARLDDPAREEAYRALGVQFVPGAKLTSKVIHEQIVREEFTFHVTFSGGDVEVVDMTIGPVSHSSTGAGCSPQEVVAIAAHTTIATTSLPVEAR